MTEPSSHAEVGPWAQEKLDALERYLSFYTTVLKNQPWRTIYLDAFAGGGLARLRKKVDREDLIGSLLADEPPASERREFILGSPRRALDIAHPFDRYVFVDADAERVRELQDLEAKYGAARTIYVRQGTATEEIDWLLRQNISKRTHRGVAFLDPFGAHLEWQSIAALAATGVFEVFINFPLHMAINRLMKVDADIPPTWRAQLDAFLGDGWYDEVYVSNAGLFGDTLVKRADALPRLLDFYRRKLQVAFGHVSHPRLIRNTVGGPLYYLLWAGPHAKGLEGANYVLRMGERTSGRGSR